MTIQELQFELIKKSSFNDFNGDLVVKSLQENKDLWQGVIMDRAGYCLHSDIFGNARENTGGEKISLIKLRDIKDGYWNVDTLYILAKEGKEKELEQLAKTWSADEVDYYSKEESTEKLGGGRGLVLRVWWD